MLIRIEAATASGLPDVVGNKVRRKIRNELGLETADVKVVKVFTVAGLSDMEAAWVVENAIVHDPVLQTAGLTPLAEDFDWVIEVGFRPGVTDNEGRTARETLAVALGRTGEARKGLAVYTSNQYVIQGKLDAGQVERIAKDLLANTLIQRYDIKSAAQWAETPGFEARAAQVTGQASSEVIVFDLASMDDAALIKLSKDGVLALSLEEMREIKAYYARPDVVAERAKLGLGAAPTDVELEALAQTWSEHCKHKIFVAEIDYKDEEKGLKSVENGLFRTYIQGSTATLRKRMGKDDFCRSVFKDNAGVVALNDDWDVCIKVETHNSPSALDPYGGALTGIVGVNRDPMGTGLGANLLFNTDVFCFASPFHEGELPPRLLHPRRVMEGVREGVEHGGNKSGIPTVNGAVVYDERFLGKPLVFCGTVGVIPATVTGRPGYTKKALPGDRIVMTGGRIGKDGIHGATFSSEELHEGSPATAVQIGDPITQRKMYDFLMRARNMGLYNAITDNGAGGLSSSVGEMAQDTGGFDLDLSKAPLKYDGLRPWEVFLSEAQERMTLAVPPEKIGEFLALAAEMDVEATDLGEYTESGRFHVRYGERTIAHLDMEFVHDGTPKMRLEAIWRKPETGPVALPQPEVEQGAFLRKMMGRLNICSREYIIRQYDHEVQGGSVVKPLVGVRRDAPGDAGVVRPILDSDLGLVISNGICPKFSDYDTYWMMAAAIDEAVRGAVATGGDIRRMAGIDNFCWCDPVQSEKTPDGRYKLAQLVRANRALAHFCLAYGIPLISGKDSMKNDYFGGGVKISIPPTVLFSLLGVIPDVNRCVTTDFKTPGDLIYVLGLTRPELGGSEACSELGLRGGEVPQVEVLSARARYLAMYEAIGHGLVSAAHDLSDGGLAVALAEMAIGGRTGARLDLAGLPALEGTDLFSRLYSESQSRFLVTVKPSNRSAFESIFAGSHFAQVGEVNDTQDLVIADNGKSVLTENVEALASAWKGTFDW